MCKIILRPILFFILFITPVLGFSQHHLYFYIPECPNAVGIESTESIDFELSPVPASNYINLQFTDTFIANETSALSVVNSRGLTVKELNIDFSKAGNKAIKLDVSHLEQGLYIIRYSDSRRIFSKKILITR